MLHSVFMMLSIYRHYTLFTPTPSLSLSLSLTHSQLSCCGYNNATDWPMVNPVYLAENNNAPPQEGGCAACTVGTDENCMRFIGNFIDPRLNSTLPMPYNFTAREVSWY